MKVLLAFFTAIHLFSSYHDEELEKLRGSIQDICTPTFEEYRLIETYLSEAKRPYLDWLRESPNYSQEVRRMNGILHFKLVGRNGEMPIREVHHFGESFSKKCILLYASYNPPYPEKAKLLLSEIKNCGYQGDVILRIGGFPNTQFGGLHICHVPYAWKVAFLQEASLLGYQEILWIDLAVHPIKNFDHLFSIIQDKGYFFTSISALSGNFSTHLPQAALALNISTDFYDQIPHISSYLIGLNMKHKKAVRLLEGWYQETENVYPNVTWWPEELSLSVVAWRLACKPLAWVGDFICSEGEFLEMRNRPVVEFYVDPRR